MAQQQQQEDEAPLLAGRGRAASGAKQAHEQDGVEDLDPTPNTPAHRTWTWSTFALVWTSTILNPGSISCGAALLALGLNWWEATLSHFLGGLITLGLLCLTAWPGVKYGIPFPVLVRSAFGQRGAHFCTLSRGAVAIMWLSFEMWAGALGLYTGFGQVLGPGFLAWGPLGSSLTAWKLILLLVFAALHIALIRVGIGRVRLLVYATTPAQLALFMGIAIWACRLAPINESLPSHTLGTASAWMTSINASIATWSTLVLNVADMSRLCPTQKDQVIGQSLGMPVPFAVTGWIGIVAAGATRVAYGTAMWQIPEYFQVWTPAWAVLGCLVFAASALVVNVTANLLSPMNDLLNLSPDRFNFRWCGYVCVVAAIAVCPWWTFSSETGFVTTFLNGYGMVTGAIAGVIIIDFWLLRRQELHLHDLYNQHPGKPFSASTLGSALDSIDAHDGGVLGAQGSCVTLDIGGGGGGGGGGGEADSSSSGSGGSGFSIGPVLGIHVGCGGQGDAQPPFGDKGGYRCPLEGQQRQDPCVAVVQQQQQCGGHMSIVNNVNGVNGVNSVNHGVGGSQGEWGSAAAAKWNSARAASFEVERSPGDSTLSTPRPSGGRPRLVFEPLAYMAMHGGRSRQGAAPDSSLKLSFEDGYGWPEVPEAASRLGGRGQGGRWSHDAHEAERLLQSQTTMASCGSGELDVQLDKPAGRRCEAPHCPGASCRLGACCEHAQGPAHAYERGCHGHGRGYQSCSSRSSHCSYQYSGNANWRAFAAVAAGVAPCTPGFVASLVPGRDAAVPPALVQLYNVSFLFALLVSGGVFWALTLAAPPVPPPGSRRRGGRSGGSSPALG